MNERGSATWVQLKIEMFVEGFQEHLFFTVMSPTRFSLSQLILLCPTRKSAYEQLFDFSQKQWRTEYHSYPYFKIKKKKWTKNITSRWIITNYISGGIFNRAYFSNYLHFHLVWRAPRAPKGGRHLKIWQENTHIFFHKTDIFLAICDTLAAAE